MSRKRNHATRRPYPPQPAQPPSADPAAPPNPDASLPELALSVGLRLRLGLSFSPSGRVGMVVDGILVALALYLGRRVYVLDPVWVSALADTPGEPPPGDHTDWQPVRGLTIVYVDDVRWMHLPTDPLPLDRMPPAPGDAPADSPNRFDLTEEEIEAEEGPADGEEGPKPAHASGHLFELAPPLPR